MQVDRKTGWCDTFGGGSYNVTHSHGLDDTCLSPLVPFVRDVLGTVDYGKALEAARAVREQPGPSWAVIDTVYADGCRGQG